MNEPIKKKIFIESPIMKNNPENKEHLNQILPKGTADLKNYQQIQAIKTALFTPYSQYLAFSPNIKHFSWIIVKEMIQNSEPIYHFYLQTLKRRFLSAKKQPNNIGCNYLISESERPQKDSQVVGKLRGNFRNNEFILYDGGQNPRKKTGRRRKQFASIKFHQQSIFSQNKSVRLQIIIPQIRQLNQQLNICPKYLPIQFIPNEQRQNLLQQQSQKNSQNVIQIIKMNQQKKQEITNILSNLLYKYITIKLKVNSSDEKETAFEMNSRGKSSLSIIFNHPLNMLQSFGIALSLIERCSNDD